jgi:hypothetical protein
MRFVLDNNLKYLILTEFLVNWEKCVLNFVFNILLLVIINSKSGHIVSQKIKLKTTPPKQRQRFLFDKIAAPLIISLSLERFRFTMIDYKT